MSFLNKKNLFWLFVIPTALALSVYIFVSRGADSYVSTAKIDVMGNLGRANSIMYSSFVTEAEGVKSAIQQDMINGGSASIVGRFGFDQSRIDINNVPPFLEFKATSASAAGAQSLNRALIDAWLPALKPSSSERVKLKKQLAVASDELALVAQKIEQLSTLRSQVPSAVASINALVLEYDVLRFAHQLEAEEKSARVLIASIRDQLAGPAREDVVVSEPDLPVSPEEKDAAVYAILSFLASLTFLIFALFIKQSYFRRETVRQGDGNTQVQAGVSQV